MKKQKLGVIIIFAIAMAVLLTPLSIQAAARNYVLSKGDKLTIADFHDYVPVKKGIIKITKKGAIIAKKEGSTELKRKGGEGNDTFKVVVVKAPKFSKSSIEIPKGAMETASISFDRSAVFNITCDSKDKKIARVKNAKIIGISVGTTVITAKVRGYTKTYTIKMNITVTENKDLNIISSIVKQQTGKDPVLFYKGDESEKKKYYNVVDPEDEEAMGKLEFLDLTSDCYQWNDEGKLINIYWDNYKDLKGEIDLSGLTALSVFDCFGNKGITGITLRENIALTKLNCSSTGIHTLDVSNNIALTKLECSNTDIHILDVSNNINLQELFCYGTKITKLEIINHPKLESLNCGKSSEETDVLELTLKNCQALRSLSCSDAGLTQLDTSECPNLVDAFIANNQLSEIDISKNRKLKSLSCRNNLLKQIDVNNNLCLNYCDKDDDTVLIGNFDKTKYNKEEVEALEAFLHGFSEIYFDLEGYKDISSLYFRWNDEGRLISMDLSYIWTGSDLYQEVQLSLNSFPELRRFIGLLSSGITSNRVYISKLDVSNNPKLEYLDCDYLFLESLDLSKNPELTYASVTGIPYKNDFQKDGDYIIDLSNNKKLNYFSCNYLRAGGLKLGENTALTELNCYTNNFTQLDVSGCSNLKVLDCSSNKLKELILEKNMALETLKCEDNEELVELDISKNTNLKYLDYSSSITKKIIGDTSNLTHSK